LSEDLCFSSASDLNVLYRRGRASPVDVTKAVLARIERLNPKINAYCLIDADKALAAARASEERWRKNAPLSPLDGVPTSIKDLLLTRGWPTLRGSKAIEREQAWDEDAPSTARLREAGAVLLGKTTTPEFGWKGVTDSRLTGITRNPWNLALTPGGSSGGAAAQVAAGLGPLAVGTDGGGSIRIPASFCGVVGLKPTFGRVPAWPLSRFGTLACVGPIARNVRDAATLLGILARPDARDWRALPPPGEDYTRSVDRGVEGLKIAFSPALGFAKVRPDVALAVAKGARLFAELGAKVEETDPGFADPTPVFWTHWTVGAYNLVRTVPKKKWPLIEAELMNAVKKGRTTTLSAYLDAVAARGALGMTMTLFHQRYDLLVTPSTAVTAFPVGQLRPTPEADNDWTLWTPFTYPFNLTHQPAISVPCGFTSDRLPIGLQIVGPLYREDLVLRAACAFFEAAAPTLRPKLEC
jgi:aspartyl-tRNA(Asn)/glutamyl-tRNA(Gln) amidotransferase subunit A